MRDMSVEYIVRDLFIHVPRVQQKSGLEIKIF